MVPVTANLWMPMPKSREEEARAVEAADPFLSMNNHIWCFQSHPAGRDCGTRVPQTESDWQQPQELGRLVPTLLELW